MQVCTSFQTHNHASTPPLGFLQAGCPSCRPTNSKKNNNNKNNKKYTVQYKIQDKTMYIKKKTLHCLLLGSTAYTKCKDAATVTDVSGSASVSMLDTIVNPKNS